MAKFLRFIGFMVLALALWQTVSDTFANKAASGGNVVSENTIAVHEQTDAYIAMPQLPYLPDAELAGMGGQLHSLTYSRIPVSYTHLDVYKRQVLDSIFL